MYLIEEGLLKRTYSARFPEMLELSTENVGEPAEHVNCGREPFSGSPAFVVLSNKEKAAKAGLVRQRTPTQGVRDDFLGKHPSMPFCIGFLVDQHNG